jgi:lipopolysaccharide/colanic/teichoic acid biosynthesis glycosyltransferase
MNTGVGHRIRFLPAACDLLACLAAFYAVSRVFAAKPTDWLVAIPASALTSWLAAISLRGREFGLSLWIDQLFYAAGLTMLSQYGLAYVFGFWPAPLGALAAGVVLSVVLMAVLRKWVRPGPAGARSRVLFLGFDSVAAALAPFFRRQIVGVVESDGARVPPDLAFLGAPSGLAKIVAENRPGRIVVAGSHASPRLLLELQYSGTPVIDGAALHENLLGRLRWDALRPMDLLFSRSTNADRMGMAVQAIYTNVIGLGSLLVLCPLLTLLAASIVLFGAGGPVLEHTECLGFQMIPFDLLRFGTRRRDGRPHGIGKTLSALHLAFLPRLINVVRGEMAFFGPPPVRVEFAQRLGRLIPVYAHRFTVKPGILGWSQMNLGISVGTPDEALRLEYDLYYVKQNSVSLDLEILLRTLFPPRSAAAREARREQGGDF